MTYWIEVKLTEDEEWLIVARNSDTFDPIEFLTIKEAKAWVKEHREDYCFTEHRISEAPELLRPNTQTNRDPNEKM